MSINVIIVGLGGVGSAVLHQLRSPRLKQVFEIAALYTSRFRLQLARGSSIDPEELLASFRSDNRSKTHGLQVVEYSGGPRFLVDSLDSFPRPLIVVDCTSSTELVALYPTILSTPGTHIVTPNKKGFSGDEALFTAIQQAKASTGNLIYHEATVGAGLPIISTLKDLVLTGDRIIRIEGVFSGTISYIFNQFSTGAPTGPRFSDIVKEAKTKGYTEPHPGDDLSGSDVARKLAILARIIADGDAPDLSLPEGYKSVETESLIPTGLEEVASGEEFVERLVEHDAYFDELRQEAASNDTVVRFVGVIDPYAPKDKRIRALVKRYPVHHAFATSLSGSDNIVLFQTERYSPNPLIIQGAGAGAAVTAMGVVSDMCRVAERVGGSL